MAKKERKKITNEFRERQSRQFLAIGVTLMLLVFLALVYKRPAFFGEFSKNTIFLLQSMLIAGFIGFSAYNWRCPSCKKYLGHNIYKSSCSKCGTRFR